MKKLLAVVFAVLLFFVVSPVFAQDQESPLKTTLHFPHWTDGDGWFNKFQFTNLLRTHAGRATLRFYNNFGNEVAVETDKGMTPLTFGLPKGGAITITTLGRSTGSTQGLAIVESDVRIAGKIEYHYPAFRIRTAVPPSPTRRAFTIFANYVKHPAFWRNTGIALANSQDKPSYVDLTLVDEGGIKVTQKRITLQPRSHIAELLDWTAFFPEFLNGREEFHGTVEVVAERNISVLALEFEGQPNGAFLMDNASPLPPRYLDMAEISKHSIQAVYFVPKGIASDPDYVSGLRFLAQEVLNWYDIELQRSGQQDLTSSVDFARDFDQKVSVGLVNGQENLVVYTDFNNPTTGNGLNKMLAELAAVYPNRNLLIAIQTNGIEIAFGGYSFAMFTIGRSNTFPEYSFKNLNADYLRNKDYKSCFPCNADTIRGLTRWKIASSVEAAAHEIGHMLGLPHSNQLDDYFPGVYANLMFTRGREDKDSGLGFFASSLIPDIPKFSGSLINVALDRGEIDTLIY
ncbi:MAG: hypothetical protein HYX20_01015 [Candidatus Yanofskybacteria bacterium]|nr:hypothetical protein [Candidatus Yanofskybacteria bacterium]